MDVEGEVNLKQAEGSSLHFFIGGYGPSHRIELDGDRISYQEFCAGIPSAPPKFTTATAEQFAKFWQTLEEIGVWSWHAKYIDPRTMDGTQWDLEIKHGPRYLQTDGSNSFPNSGNTPGLDLTPETSFYKFLLALEALTGTQIN